MATRKPDQDPPRQQEESDAKVRKSTKKTTQKSSSTRDSRNATDSSRSASANDRSVRKNELSASRAAALAMRQVMELAGRDPESVTSLERTEHGWRVGVEVVETRRIPDSADILAVYDAELDEDGELQSYRRRQRYPRGHQE